MEWVLENSILGACHFTWQGGEASTYLVTGVACNYGIGVTGGEGSGRGDEGGKQELLDESWETEPVERASSAGWWGTHLFY